MAVHRHLHICTSAHMYVGWLRLVGPAKLQVSFAEYRLFYRALLQKRPRILRCPLIVATQHVYGCTQTSAHTHTYIRIITLTHTSAHMQITPPKVSAPL